VEPGNIPMQAPPNVRYAPLENTVTVKLLLLVRLKIALTAIYALRDWMLSPLTPNMLVEKDIIA